MNLNLKQLNLRRDENHVYTLNGERLAGVTRIIKVRAQEFLMHWPSKEMYKYLLENWDLSKQYTVTEKEELLQNGKTAYLKKSKEGRDVGRDVHEWLEKYLKKQPLPEVKEKKVQNSIDSFLTWEKKHTVEWVALELMVVSEKYKYAGTIDAVAIIDGLLTVLDFKTNNFVNENAFLQTAAYQLALEEMSLDPLQIHQRAILQIPKIWQRYQTGESVDHINVPTPLDFDKQSFLYLREFHKWNFWIEKYCKDERGFISIEKIKELNKKVES